MNSYIAKTNIKLFLSRFETLVRISSQNNEYDINKHSETFLIPFLKKVYGWNLVNANIEDRNAKSIDLIDTQRQIAIQVSSDTSLEKIKTTIQKFLTSKYKNRINKLYFYFLLPKQKTYSNDAILKITGKKIKFNIKSNILDNTDIYSAIQYNTDVNKIKDIDLFLAAEFSDFNLLNNISIHDYESFKQNYKESCLNNYTRLNFFGLSIPNKPREVQLYSLFVKPDFGKQILDTNLRFRYAATKQLNLKLSDTKEIWEKHDFQHFLVDEKGILFKKLFNLTPHLVLLGNPGAGKSSLIKYSICKIIEEDFDIFENRDIYNYLPYRIELHKYNQFKKVNSGGFVDFIKHNLIDEFQIDVKPRVLTEIIEKFPSIIFFDGLDEIFDIQERLQVRNDIENFIRLHPFVKSVVTSRYESYEEVKLNKEKFSIFEVKEFDNKQITEYVEKWYSIEEVNEKVKKHETRDCLEQLKNVDSQLKHNPLLLSLILILYRNEQDLPTSKLEIYEGCAQTLIETRDKKEKKLDLELKISHKVSVFSNLAYWQFTNESNKSSFKIDYHAIENFVTKYLLDKGEFEDISKSEDAAKQFLEYAKIRSIYFENKFTHKTFYEYFTAYYIYSNYYSTPGEYGNFITLVDKNIGLSSWAVILELLICKIDKAQIEYKVMDGIINHLIHKKPYETCHLFTTIMPHLRTVSPAKNKELISATLKLLLFDKNEKNQSSILEKLLELIKIKRFRETFISIINTEIEKKSIESIDYFDFIFELQTITKSKDFKNIIDAHSNHQLKYPEKYFILSNMEDILNKSKMLSVFDLFVKKFGKDSTLKIYKSNFRLPIFKREYSFFWLSFLITKMDTESELRRLSSKFRSVGIQRSDIKNMAKHGFLIDSNIFPFSMNNLAKYKSVEFFEDIHKEFLDFIKKHELKISETVSPVLLR
jgi:hypothetical protein